MTPREIEEYRALRDTIRERGTTRVWVVLLGLFGWSALAVTTTALVALPVVTLIPLSLLAVTFEIVLALHTGVERVGRYIQVFYEDDDRGWEHAAMEYGRRFPGGGSDPLFATCFAIAGLFNFVPVALAGAVPVEYAVTGAFHVLFLARLVLARRQSAGQRALDLDRFRKLKSGHDPAAP